MENILRQAAMDRICILMHARNELINKLDGNYQEETRDKYLALEKAFNDALESEINFLNS